MLTRTLDEELRALALGESRECLVCGGDVDEVDGQLVCRACGSTLDRSRTEVDARETLVLF
jgi:predicted amidophosphoribosyltransferase